LSNKAEIATFAASVSTGTVLVFGWQAVIIITAKVKMYKVFFIVFGVLVVYIKITVIQLYDENYDINKPKSNKSYR
jgi:hypothetical protein